VGLNKLVTYKRSMSVLPLFLDDIIYVEYPSQFMYFFTNLLLLSNARLFLPATLIFIKRSFIFKLKRTQNNVEMYITWSYLYEYGTLKNRASLVSYENVLEIFLSLSLDRRYLGAIKVISNELDTVSTV